MSETPGSDPSLFNRLQRLLPARRGERVDALVVPPPPQGEANAAREPYVSPALKIGAAWSWRIVAVAAGALLVLYGLSKITIVVIPILVSLLLAALLAPVSSFLTRIGLPRAISALITFLGSIAVVAGLLTMVGQQLVAGFPGLLRDGERGFQSVMDWLSRTEPFGIDAGQLATITQDAVDGVLDWANKNSSLLLNNAAAVGSSTGIFVTGFLLTLFTTFFFLYDGRNIFEWSTRLLPKPARERSKGAALRGWQSLVQYVRVQILVAFIDAVGIAAVAFFLGLELWFPLGVLVFLASFIPIVGAVSTGALAVVVALVTQGFWPAVIMLIGVLAVQQIESNVLQPLIMGKAVSVHPLGVILAVTVGGFSFGIVGALFAVPVVAVLNTMILYLNGRDIFAELEERNRQRGPNALVRLFRRMRGKEPHGEEAPAETAAPEEQDGVKTSHAGAAVAREQVAQDEPDDASDPGEDPPTR